jgi:O-antigen/teichoic acid export membrane protein
MAIVSSPAPGSVGPNTIRRTAWNTLSNYVVKLLSLAIGVVLTPFILREVGPRNFGLWVLVGSVTGYGALLDLGISNAIVRYVAEYRARGKSEQAQQLVATALWLYIALGLVVIACSALLAPWFPRLFQVPETEAAATAQLVYVVGVGQGWRCPAALLAPCCAGCTASPCRTP